MAEITQFKADDDDDREVEAALRAIAFIKSLRPAPDSTGKLTCTLCGGWLYFRVVGSRCHVRAKCETDGCLELLE